VTLIQSNLFFVVRKFPDRAVVIKRLFRENESFQTLCEDYGLCAEALKRWNESASQDAPARRREYAELLGDLESEICKYLDEFESKEHF
jgi:hypothetical protein